MSIKFSRKIFSLFSCILFGFMAGCGVKKALNFSGKLETVSRSVKNFHAVSFDGIGNLKLIQGDKEGLVIVADSAVLPLIKTDVQNGVLQINFEHKMSMMLNGSQKIHFHLSFRNLSKLTISGVARVAAASLTAKNFDINSAGASVITIGNLSCDHLKVALPGAGTVDLSGKSNQANFNLSGLGTIHAGQLKTLAANIEIAGAGKATVWAVHSLNAQVLGAGSVDYYGNPTVNKTVLGVGTVKQIGASPPSISDGFTKQQKH